MTTLTGFRTRIAQVLLDTSNTIWPTNALDEALRAALDDYTRAAPLLKETLLTLIADGREIALDSLANLITVTDVIWPYDADVWPPAHVAFRLIWDDARPVLVINADDGAEPQAADDLRLYYTAPHTIQDLDSAGVTTLYPGHESDIIHGAAGYAAISRGADLIEKHGGRSIDAPRIEAWGQRKLEAYSRRLLRLSPAFHRASAPTYAPTAWTLDKWAGQS